MDSNGPSTSTYFPNHIHLFIYQCAQGFGSDQLNVWWIVAIGPLDHCSGIGRNAQTRAVSRHSHGHHYHRVLDYIIRAAHGVIKQRVGGQIICNGYIHRAALLLPAIGKCPTWAAAGELITSEDSRLAALGVLTPRSGAISAESNFWLCLSICFGPKLIVSGLLCRGHQDHARRRLLCHRGSPKANRLPAPTLYASHWGHNRRWDNEELRRWPGAANPENHSSWIRPPPEHPGQKKITYWFIRLASRHQPLWIIHDKWIVQYVHVAIQR